MPGWTTTHTVTSTASPHAIWARLADVPNWPDWDHGVDWVRLDGPLAPGTKGTLKPDGGPRTPFTVTEVDPGRRMTDVSRLPLARLTFEHTIAPTPQGGATLTHHVTITGPLKALFARLIGRDIAADLPETMGRLVALAEADARAGERRAA